MVTRNGIRKSVGCRCCVPCHLPDQLCFEVSNNAEGYNLSGVMRYHPTTPTWLPTVTTTTGSVYDTLFLAVSYGHMGNVGPSSGSGYYSDLIYWDTCEYDHEVWHYNTGFGPVDYFEWTATDDYYLQFVMYDSISGAGKSPGGYIAMIQYIFRNDATMRQYGAIGFGGLPYDFSEYHTGITLCNGSVIWHTPVSYDTTNACESFICDWSDVYIKGFAYNPSPFIFPQATCPTIGDYTLNYQYIPFNTTFYDYGSLTCTDPSTRCIIECVDCDDAAIPVPAPSGKAMAFGGGSNGRMGNGDSGGTNRGDGYTSDSPSVGYRYTGSIGGADPQNRLGTFGGSASVQLSAYGYDQITGSVGQLSGIAGLKLGVKASGLGSLAVIGGLAGFSGTVKPVASGKGSLSGSVDASVTGVYLGQGGLVSFGGLATCSSSGLTASYSYDPSGQLTISGLAVTKTGATIKPSGKLLFNGIGVNGGSVNYNPSGKLLSSGINFTNTQTSGQLTFSGIATCSGGQTIVDFTTAGTTSWTVPAGVTSIKVEALGGGGNGGGTGLGAAGGGKGGDYSLKNSYSVTPGASLSITVGGANQDSYIGDGSLFNAEGGTTPGLIGGNNPSIGDTIYTGGTGGGGSGKGNVGGASGGTCGGLSANGNNGVGNSGTTGGAAPTAIVSLGGTYTGGAGGTYNTVAATNGQTGCGGGGKYTGSTNGSGGVGWVRITY